MEYDVDGDGKIWKDKNRKIPIHVVSAIWPIKNLIFFIIRTASTILCRSSTFEPHSKVTFKGKPAFIFATPCRPIITLFFSLVFQWRAQIVLPIPSLILTIFIILAAHWYKRRTLFWERSQCTRANLMDSRAVFMVFVQAWKMSDSPSADRRISPNEFAEICLGLAQFLTNRHRNWVALLFFNWSVSFSTLALFAQ